LNVKQYSRKKNAYHLTLSYANNMFQHRAIKKERRKQNLVSQVYRHASELTINKPDLVFVHAVLYT